MNFQRIFNMLSAPTFVYSISKSEVVLINEQAQELFGNINIDLLGLISPVYDLDVELWMSQLSLWPMGEEMDTYLERKELGGNQLLKLTAKKYQDEGEQFAICTVYIMNPENDISRNEMYHLLIDSLNLILESEDVAEGVNYILSRIGIYMDVSRVYIFEFSKDRNYCDNTYEWCNRGIVPQIDILQHVDVKPMRWIDILMEEGIIAASDIHDLDEFAAAVLEPQNVKSIMVLPLVHCEVLYGFIGFDECNNQKEWSKEEIGCLSSVSTVISYILFRGDRSAYESEFEVFRTVSDNLKSLIYTTDLETNRILFANKALKDIIGDRELEGKLCWEMLPRAGLPSDDGRLKENLLDGNRKPLPPHESELYDKRLGKWFSITDAAIRWVDGRYVHMEQATDITQMKENEALLQYYAKTDMMTGAYKRDWGIQHLEKMLNVYEGQDKKLTVCFLDLDCLKYINDNFGHNMGDIAIKKVVEILNENLRRNDFICRMGGDEFLIIMEDCDAVRAKKVFKRVKEQMEQINQTHIYQFNIRISVGIVDAIGNERITADRIIKLADRNMYIEKRAKKR